MFKNLIRILRDKNISNKSLADMLGVSEKTVWNKLTGQTEFTLGEAIKISQIICPEYRMDYVFKVYQDEAA